MQIRAKVVEGRLHKLKAAQALLEQPFIRSETNETVDTVLKQQIAEIGEKISIRRFVRYDLGEGLEKKNEDFAAEVAAQTEKKESAPEPEKPKVCSSHSLDRGAAGTSNCYIRPLQVPANAWTYSGSVPSQCAALCCRKRSLWRR
jgi:hypothetical protein